VKLYVEPFQESGIVADWRPLGFILDPPYSLLFEQQVIILFQKPPKFVVIVNLRRQICRTVSGNLIHSKNYAFIICRIYPVRKQLLWFKDNNSAIDLVHFKPPDVTVISNIVSALVQPSD